MFKRLLTFVLIAACVVSTSSLYGVSVLLDGVAEGDTRYDSKKLFNGKDDNLCWAFSVSNAIKYWQNSKSAQGVEIPSGTPLGIPTADYSSDITQTFVDNWENYGGEECNGFDWWFSGNISMPDDSGGITSESSGLKQDATGGSYWIGTPYAEGTISVEFVFDETENDYLALTEVIDNAIENGWALTCGIYSDQGGHAITLWGYEMDEVTREVTGLWICDSDNEFIGNYMVELDWNGDEFVWELGNSLSEDDYTGWYLGDISILMAGSTVPEPSVYAAFFGIIALAFAIVKNNLKGV